MRIDGHDNAIIGRGDVWGSDGTRPSRLVYDGLTIVADLMDQGMTEEEAVEYIEYNIIGAYVGPTTPVVIWPVWDDGEYD